MEKQHLLIVGLGNPGRKYETTRHNIGFMILDSWVEENSLTWGQDKNSLYTKTFINEVESGGDRISLHLAKPQEFMNLSGKEVSRLARLYKISVSNILIVHDEIDIPFGKIKNKVGGGTAGHNGLGDIVNRLGDKGFHRLRFGVGKPTHPDFAVADYVLQNFSSEEKKELGNLIDESKKRMGEWIQMRIREWKNEDKT